MHIEGTQHSLITETLKRWIPEERKAFVGWTFVIPLYTVTTHKWNLSDAGPFDIQTANHNSHPESPNDINPKRNCPHPRKGYNNKIPPNHNKSLSGLQISIQRIWSNVFTLPC